jgi:tight adherence protein C
MTLLLVLFVLLVAAAVVLIVSAVLEPRLRRSENLSQIEAYGYADRSRPALPETRKRRSLDDVATQIGDLVAARFLSIREDELQRELVAAGIFNLGARRFLGYRALLAAGLPIVTIWLLGLYGSSAVLVIIVAIFAGVIGWIGPKFYVHRRARTRLDSVDSALPKLIDLLVVTLEAGVSFNGALRMSADRLTGPIGEEVALTVQEQALGLSTLESLENWLRRCDTPAVRSFVRAMVQGDRLGVSIGQILRNQAVEMRARQKAKVEAKAQRAPIKILFPLVFLIFPAMFVVILGPAIFQIKTVFHG